MDEYKPTPFTRAWGNDEDYQKLTRKLERDFGIKSQTTTKKKSNKKK
jgi:hypothetical protein